MNDRIAGTELRIGDLVRLKSGGPEMAVAGSLDNDIRVLWFDKTGDDYGELCSANFPRGTLDVLN